MKLYHRLWAGTHRADHVGRPLLGGLNMALLADLGFLGTTANVDGNEQLSNFDASRKSANVL